MHVHLERVIPILFRVVGAAHIDELFITDWASFHTTIEGRYPDKCFGSLFAQGYVKTITSVRHVSYQREYAVVRERSSPIGQACSNSPAPHHPNIL